MTKRKNTKNGRHLYTVRETVKALGGTASVASFCGLGMPSVSGWMKEGYIPPGWHYRFHVRAQSLGYVIEPCVFGLDPQGMPLKRQVA